MNMVEEFAGSKPVGEVQTTILAIANWYAKRGISSFRLSDVPWKLLPYDFGDRMKSAYALEKKGLISIVKGQGMDISLPQKQESLMKTSDKNVIDLFLDKKPGDSKRLTSDGTSLDGNWMGGNKLAYWKNGKIYFSDAGGRIEQSIQNMVKKAAPKNWLGEGATTMKMSELIERIENMISDEDEMDNDDIGEDEDIVESGCPNGMRMVFGKCVKVSGLSPMKQNAFAKEDKRKAYFKKQHPKTAVNAKRAKKFQMMRLSGGENK